MRGLISNFYPAKALTVLKEQTEGEESYLVLSKERQALAPQDSIDSWTFGIITDGKRNEQVDTVIESIHAQNIPHYEIIVCGTYYDRQESHFSYIHFNEHDDKGWITRKKTSFVKKPSMKI